MAKTAVLLVKPAVLAGRGGVYENGFFIVKKFRENRTV
jgi:hypothetical protein